MPAPLLGSRDYGSAVIYDGKVLIIGGGDPPTDSVELIDLNQQVPNWVPRAPLLPAPFRIGTRLKHRWAYEAAASEGRLLESRQCRHLSECHEHEACL